MSRSRNYRVDLFCGIVLAVFDTGSNSLCVFQIVPARTRIMFRSCFVQLLLVVGIVPSPAQLCTLREFLVSLSSQHYLGPKIVSQQLLQQQSLGQNVDQATAARQPPQIHRVVGTLEYIGQNTPPIAACLCSSPNVD